MKIDWARADEAPLVRELVDRWWKRGHVLARDEALLRWQYRFPGDDERLSVLLTRDDGGRPVGFLGIVQAAFCRRGEVVRGGWLATWTVAEEARETQAGLALLLEALRGFDVVGCLGFNEQAEAIYRRLGYEVRTPVPRFVALEPRGERPSGWNRSGGGSGRLVSGTKPARRNGSACASSTQVKSASHAPPAS